MKQKDSISTSATPFDGLTDYASARAIAISAGDLSVVVRREVRKTLQENRNSILGSLDAGLDDLLGRGLIADRECANLKGICKHLISAIRGKEDGEEAFLAIRVAYHDMLTNQHSSPTALAIASVVTSAFNLERSSPLTITPETTGAGAAVGAVIGGVIGGIVGGGLGAGIGAAIGGAAGGAIGLCNETGT